MTEAEQPPNRIATYIDTDDPNDPQIWYVDTALCSRCYLQTLVYWLRSSVHEEGSFGVCADCAKAIMEYPTVNVLDSK